MGETRKLAAILVSDVVGYSRLAGADEDRILARLRALRSDLIDPTIAVHHGRVVKRTGDGAIVEFRSVVDAVRCAIEVQNAMVERNAGVSEDRRIDFRVGIHIGDVVEESDGDLMGDGVNIAARLEGIAAPGAICLSEQAYWQVKGRLDLAVTDLGPTQLKNIAEPVRAYSLEVGKRAQAKPAPETKPPEPKKRSAWAPLAAGIAALLVMIALGTGYFLFATRSPSVATSAPSPVAANGVAPVEAAHLSLVVLPFANLSNDPNQDYFADGITENLTTEMSLIRGSFVIARNTAFAFKGKAIDAKEIGKELGVRYVLEGSVQRDQGRVRVNAQLIDAASGAHIWADRFDEDVADLFKLQDEVVARLANTLGLELVKAEAEKSTRSTNPNAIDLNMRGLALMITMFQQGADMKEINHAGRALFEQALAIDPNDPDALAGSARTYVVDYYFQWGATGTDYDAKVVGQTDRAIALDPRNEYGYHEKSMYLNMSGRSNEGFRTANEGLANIPNSSKLYNVRAYAEINIGRFEEAKADIFKAMRLSPRDPFINLWRTNLADAEMGLGNFDTAIDLIHQSIDAGYRVMYTYRELAAAYALKGRMEDAKTALAEALRLDPTLTVKSAARTNSCRSFSMPCARRGCRRNEASLKAACWSGCDARRLSTGRSIRADSGLWGGLAVAQLSALRRAADSAVSALASPRLVGRCRFRPVSDADSGAPDGSRRPFWRSDAPDTVRTRRVAVGEPNSRSDQPPPPWTCGSPIFSICCLSNGTGSSGRWRHQEGYSLRAVHARVGHDERIDLSDELVGRRDRFGDVVKPGGDSAEAQPLVSRHQALDVGGSDDLEVVFDRQRADQLRVRVHDKRGKIELAVANHAKGRRWLNEMISGKVESIEAIATREGVSERSAQPTAARNLCSATRRC